MAYEFTQSSSQSLSVGSAPVTAVPLTIVCFYRSKNTHSGGIIEIGNSSQDSNFALYRDSQSQVYAYANNGGTFGQASTTISNNVWHHCAGVFTSNTSRTIYYNGLDSGTNTANVTPSGVNTITIGRLTTLGVNWHANAFIAECAVYNAALTADEIASLAKGMTCDKVRPQNLVFYAPLVRDLIDQKGGRVITTNNGATVANHPQVYA